MTKASDNVFPKVILGPLGAPSAPSDASWKVYPMADGVYARSSNTTVGPLGAGSITVQDEGTPLATAATTLNFVGAGVAATGTGATKTITIGGGGGGVDATNVDYSTLASNATINSSSWMAVNTATDLVLAAVAGDLIEVEIAERTGTESVQMYQDMYSIVSASPVNSIGLTGAAPSGTSGVGVIPWVADSGLCRIYGSVFYVVQSGDLSGGNITIRWYARHSGGNKTIEGGSRISAVNWGQ